ncbi:hypothetical protein [Paenarthrobacter sp. NPDC057981]|uniref:hypothetical protein n=1 Tax=Paenarthrobacter sp. NPDC057981 TaxID=3346297 RepID=UPI0036DA9DEE
MTTAGENGSQSSGRNWVERHPVGTGVLGVLLAGVLGAGSAVWGAQVSSEASYRIANAQLQVAAEQKAKDQKESTYRSYLDAANSYRNAAVDLFGGTAPADAKTAWSSFMTARAKFQEQTNEIYVYGSNDAWEAHLKVAKTLPPALGDASLSFSATDVSSQPAFTAAYRGFLEVRCREVPAQVRSGCASG